MRIRKQEILFQLANNPNGRLTRADPASFGLCLKIRTFLMNTDGSPDLPGVVVQDGANFRVRL